MNAAIRAATLVARAPGVDVVGIERGHRGLLDGAFIPLAGVDTTMSTIVEGCDKIADTATAHDRTFIVEVMGRDCGQLAMTSAIGAGADLPLFPEAGKPEPRSSQIVDTVLTVRRRARRTAA